MDSLTEMTVLDGSKDDVTEDTLFEVFSCKASKGDTTTYDFGYPHRGIAVVICNQNFTNGNEERLCADNELKCMNAAFKAYHFKVFLFKNLNKKQTIDVLQAAAACEINSYSDTFACVIATHGFEVTRGSASAADENKTLHCICTTDDNVPTDEITILFDENNCPDLAGKPKMFFLQACRGASNKAAAIDHGVGVVTYDTASQTSEASNQGTGSETNSDVSTAETKDTDNTDMFGFIKHFIGKKKDRAKKIPVLAPVCRNDYLIVYSSPSGKNSYAKDKNGGWLIDCLYKLMDAYNTTYLQQDRPVDFLLMLTQLLHLGSYYWVNTLDKQTGVIRDPESHTSKAAFVMEHRLTKDIVFHKK